MDEKNRISKEGLNNIFNTSKPLSPREAARKYNSLSPKAREEVNGWINRAFHLKTGFPSNQKLDPNNPDHSEYVEEWLNQRSYVMGWNRNWEKSPGNLDTMIFGEKTPPTSPEVLKRKTGIFEQRMSPKEFNRHVLVRLEEASAYDGTSSMQDARRKIATGLAEKLLTYDTWAQNAVSTREGRSALHSIRLWIQGSVFGGRARGIDSKQRELVQKLNAILDPYKPAEFHEAIVNYDNNRKTFLRSFPILAEHIKKGLEKEGYQVGEVYYRIFTGNLIEVRAETTKQTKVEQSSYGYRGDPYVSTVKTEKKDISVGGIDLRTGVYHDASFFEKHGTAETDWGTQLMLGEVAVLAGLGVRAIVFGSRATVIGGRRAVSGATERFVGREIRDSLDDVARAGARTGDTIPGVGPHRMSVRIRTSDEPVDALTDTMRLSRETSSTGPVTMPPQLAINPQIVRNLSDDILNTVGEDLSARALSYGYTGRNLSNYITHARRSGLTRTQIRANFEREMQVHDALYDLTYRSIASRRASEAVQSSMVDTQIEVRAAIQASDGDLTSAIANQRFHDKLAKWHRIDKGVNMPGPHVMDSIDREAKQFAKKLVAQIMGSSSAGGFILYQDRKQETQDVSNLRKGEAATRKKPNEKVENKQLPRIREKGKRTQKKKPSLREKKV